MGLTLVNKAWALYESTTHLLRLYNVSRPDMKWMGWLDSIYNDLRKIDCHILLYILNRKVFPSNHFLAERKEKKRKVVYNSSGICTPIIITLLWPWAIRQLLSHVTCHLIVSNIKFKHSFSWRKHNCFNLH